MPYVRLKYLIGRFVSGDITFSEKLELQEYFNNAHQNEVKTLLNELNRDNIPFLELSQVKADKIFSRIIDNKVARPAKLISGKWLYAAASVLFFIALTSAVFYFSNSSNSKHYTQHIQAKTKSSKYAMLPDSSKVVLSKNSSVTYSLSAETRKVQLSGEAFFDIKHNAKQPFVVYAGMAKITVLGTSFNVKTEANGHITVTVKSGKVKVEHANKVVAMLETNQQVTIDSARQMSDANVVNAVEDWEWSKSDLQFDDATLEEVALAIEMQYNMPIEFADPEIKNSRLTASFKKDKSLKEVLEVVTRVNSMQYSIKENKVVISAK